MEGAHAGRRFQQQGALRIHPPRQAGNGFTLTGLNTNRLALMRMAGMPIVAKCREAVAFEARQIRIERADQTEQKIIAVNRAEVRVQVCHRLADLMPMTAVLGPNTSLAYLSAASSINTPASFAPPT